LIFNTAVYYLLFLIPAACLFRTVGPGARPWVCVAFGVGFFLYFSGVQFGGAWGMACVLIFLWESLFRSLYRPGSWTCLAGVAISVAILGVFKYWNFATGLAFAGAESNPLRWAGAFLPLGVSFFTFEFIHYAVDRYKGRVERGTFGEYLAFIFFFPTMVAGPIKRFQDFVPCLRDPSRDTARDWNRGSRGS
jgi:alginate O-acetyltransferase complex protein AlgI